MKKPTLFIMLFCVISISYAQVGIGTVTPNNSSELDIESADKGVLIPRMTNAQKNSISDPATGLMVYDTTNKCTSVNTGTPGAPDWECLNKTKNTTVPVSIISDESLPMRESLNYRRWRNVPDLNATFTILEDELIRIDWTLFVGHESWNATNEDGTAQLFTIIEINGVNDPLSCNFMQMVHNPGDNRTEYYALMNNSTYSYVKELTPGTYTVRARVYLAALLGSTTGIRVGMRINNWAGGDNMTNEEKFNAASNKLIINFL